MPPPFPFDAVALPMKGAVSHRERCAAGDAIVENAPAGDAGRVGTDGAVVHRKRRAATAAIVIDTAAESRRISGQGAIADRQHRIFVVDGATYVAKGLAICDGQTGDGGDGPVLDME